MRIVIGLLATVAGVAALAAGASAAPFRVLPVGLVRTARLQPVRHDHERRSAPRRRTRPGP